MKFIIFIVLSAVCVGVQAGDVPELWSSIKDLNKSKEACEVQSSFVLQGMDVKSRTENDYGIYAVIKSNRVVIKCIAVAKNKSKLLVAVAGDDRDAVELIRNALVKAIN